VPPKPSIPIATPCLAVEAVPWLRNIETNFQHRHRDAGEPRAWDWPVSGLTQAVRHKLENGMNAKFEIAGPIAELSSYPRWTQDMVGDCEATRRSVVEHEVIDLMRNLRLNQEGIYTFMVGIWPVIERFPGYMAQSLLKTRFGRSAGDDLARRWLVRNIRVEQNHAEHWLKWADGLGISRQDVLHAAAPYGTEALASWCEEISAKGSLAAGMAATNYAVEGATGEWACVVCAKTTYADSLPEDVRGPATRWLRLHAEYDDTHPWEALDIVATLLGHAPSAQQIAEVRQAIRSSFVYMEMALDNAMLASLHGAFDETASNASMLQDLDVA
jgi:pyrroloquinoline quinone (PQQ) biosynthesis protein C